MPCRIPETVSRYLQARARLQRGDPDNTFGNSGVISSGAFAKAIRQVRNDGSIKGVILRVNSPGGDASASDEILHELKLLSRAKPLSSLCRISRRREAISFPSLATRLFHIRIQFTARSAFFIETECT